MASIRETLQSFNLARIADAIEGMSKESLRLVPSKPGEDPVTRLGGRPNLPADLAWPIWRSNHLAFIAQVDLASLPIVHGLDLPSTGSLYFFYEGGENAWGYSPDHRGSAKVLFSAQPIPPCECRPYPQDLDKRLHFSGVHLDSQVELTVPDIEDVRLRPLNLSKDEQDRYLDFLGAWNNEDDRRVDHRIGGYPDCIQGDPFLQAQLVSHGLHYDSKGYQEARKLGLEAGAADWELLLQVNTDDAAEMMWGDAGTIYFLIHRDDLSARRFGNAWLVLECF